MASKARVEVRLTLGEAKAIMRFANSFAVFMDASKEPEFLIRRAVRSCKSGLAKMEAVIAAADPEFRSTRRAGIGPAR